MCLLRARGDSQINNSGFGLQFVCGHVLTATEACASTTFSNSVHAGHHLLEQGKNVPGESEMRQSPFTGAFRRMCWVSRSLLAYDNTNTWRYALGLAADHDFMALTETRLTPKRDKFARDHLPNTIVVSSFLDQYKGGLGLLVKKTFYPKRPFGYAMVSVGKRLVGLLASSGCVWMLRRVCYVLDSLRPETSCQPDSVSF